MGPLNWTRYRPAVPAGYDAIRRLSAIAGAAFAVSKDTEPRYNVDRSVNVRRIMPFDWSVAEACPETVARTNAPQSTIGITPEFAKATRSDAVIMRMSTARAEWSMRGDGGSDVPATGAAKNARNTPLKTARATN